MAQGVLGFFQAFVWVVWNVGLYWQRVSEPNVGKQKFEEHPTDAKLDTETLAMVEYQISETTSH